jgi:hypothetical protein
MDSCSIIFAVIIVSVVVIVIAAWITSMVESAKLERMTPDERDAYQETKRKAAQVSQAQTRDLQYGPVNPQMICPHCQSRGTVRTKRITQKKGISGGKATAAVLTAGVSMLATGLSRKEAATEASCDNCRSTWYF